MRLKSYAVKIDQGPYLQLNEDGYIVDFINGFFLILDGLGGSGIGDKGVDLIKESMQTFYTKTSTDPDSTLPFFYSPRYLLEGNALINAMHYSHALLKKENEKKELSFRGAASGIGMSLGRNVLTFSSVGNCAAYLYRKGILEQLIRSDSFFALASDASPSPFQNLPMSAFGLFDDLHLNNSELRVSEEDLIVLMTDGVYGHLSLHDIQQALKQTDLPDVKIIESLLYLANSRGNRDNQTTIFLRF